MTLHKRLAAHLVLLQRTARAAYVGHLLATAAIKRLITVITVFRHLVDHCRAVVQRRTLGAKGALRIRALAPNVGARGHRAGGTRIPIGHLCVGRWNN